MLTKRRKKSRSILKVTEHPSASIFSASPPSEFVFLFEVLLDWFFNWAF
jgi:hypothetical protein